MLSREYVRRALLLLCLAAGLPARADDPPTQTLSLDVGGMLFTARTAGPPGGELVILLHGFPQTSFAYHRLLPALAAAGFRAVAPDQRGYSPGARPPEVDAYQVGRLVADVLGMADAVGVRRFHLVGHDWGGAVAWGVASRHPERLLSLTVLSTPHPAALALARQDADQTERSGYMTDLAADNAEERLLAGGAAGLRRILGSPALAPEEREVYVSALGSRAALRGALNWYRALLSARGATAAPTSPRPPGKVPTLYVWGAEDPVFSPEAARATARFVAGPYSFEPIEGAGHWLLEGETARVEKLLLTHLTRHAADAGTGLEARASYERARGWLERAIEAAGGRATVLGAFPVSARYEGFHLAIGQSLAPEASPARLDISGSFAVDATARVFMEQTLVNVGGTDRTFRRTFDGGGGWNDWVPRRLLTQLKPADAAVLRGIDYLYPPRALPHAVLAEAARHAPSLRWLGARDEGGMSVARLSFADDDAQVITLLVDAESGGLLGYEHLGSDFERGDQVWQTLYAEPTRVAGVSVPGRVSFLRDGEEVEAWSLRDFKFGQGVDLGVFDRPADRKVTEYIPSFEPRKVAEGVWMVRLYSGPANSYNTMLVEFDTYLAVMEAPLVDLLSGVVTRMAARLAPGKPIRYVIPTHAHFDHIGGIRAHLAAGVTAIATPRTTALLERLPQARLTLRPDPLAASRQKPSIETFEASRVIREGEREMRIYDVGPSPHSQEIAIGYLPAEKVLFVSDLFALPDNGLPAPRGPALEAFVKRVEELGLDVETVIAGHGLPATWADVVGAGK